MYMYMYTYMYMYIYIYICMYVCINVYIDVSIYTVASMLRMGSRIQRGKTQRPGQSSASIPEADLAEIVMFLSGTSGQGLQSLRPLMAAFGINAAAMPRFDLSNELLPFFFCSSARSDPFALKTKI